MMKTHTHRHTERDESISSTTGGYTMATRRLHTYTTYSLFNRDNEWELVPLLLVYVCVPHWARWTSTTQLNTSQFTYRQTEATRIDAKRARMIIIICSYHMNGYKTIKDVAEMIIILLFFICRDRERERPRLPHAIMLNERRRWQPIFYWRWCFSSNQQHECVCECTRSAINNNRHNCLVVSMLRVSARVWVCGVCMAASVANIHFVISVDRYLETRFYCRRRRRIECEC